MANWLQKQWLSCTIWQCILTPLSWLFLSVSWIRRFAYHCGLLQSHRLPVPVIVVGNITVGGTGKTPLVISLVEHLTLQGFKPGVISRGFGRQGADLQAPRRVSPNSNPAEFGDEPVLIANRLTCPVYISANRVAAAKALLQDNPQCNLLISDDGLQHYALKRDVEVVVVDAAKGFSNGKLLPAGPLREPLSRLVNVDLIVVNGDKATYQAFVENNLTHIHRHIFTQHNTSSLSNQASKTAVINMQLAAGDFYALNDPNKKVSAEYFAHKTMTAIAGIGNPDRFFSQLTNLGLTFSSQAFADHYAYTAADLSAITSDIILMTEKDAVKCRQFNDDRIWVLPVQAVFDDTSRSILFSCIQRATENLRSNKVTTH